MADRHVIQPKVSVVIPCYNVETYLSQCLESVLAQTCRDIEVICVNDGSKDGSLDVIRRYAAQDSRILVIDKKNSGYGNSVNRGIDTATGEYIGIVEPDDYIDADMYEKLYECATSFSPKAQIVRSAYHRVMRDGDKREFIYPSPHKGRVKPASQPFTIEQCGEILFYHPSIWSAIYEKSFLEEEGIRLPEYPGAGWADNPFFMQTLLAAKRIAYVDECFYCYREDNIGASSDIADYHMPLERWNDVQDIVEAAHALYPDVLESQAVRGFNYIMGARHARNAAGNEADIESRAKAMYRRMDEDSVLRTDRLSKAQKQEYLSVVDPGYRGKIAGGFRKRLVSEFVHTVREGGFGVAFFRMRDFLRKRRSAR